MEARYGGRLGVPAVFSSIFFPDLLAVSGDRGARGILERNSARVGAVDFLEGELDLDTPDDLERMISNEHRAHRNGRLMPKKLNPRKYGHWRKSSRT
jgi:CTP:molybdopterin cytidylyltransferase MocA